MRRGCASRGLACDDQTIRKMVRIPQHNNDTSAPQVGTTYFINTFKNSHLQDFEHKANAMEPGEELIKVASEWPSINGTYKLTNAQRKRIAKGKSIYEKDKVTEKYDCPKGEWV